MQVCGDLKEKYSTLPLHPLPLNGQTGVLWILGTFRPLILPLFSLKPKTYLDFRTESKFWNVLTMGMFFIAIFVTCKTVLEVCMPSIEYSHSQGHNIDTSWGCSEICAENWDQTMGIGISRLSHLTNIAALADSKLELKLTLCFKILQNLSYFLFGTHCL